MLTGHCLCGDVTFALRAPPRDACYCHCTQCRRQSGHYWASGTVSVDDVDITGDVRWFAASAIAKRGFCPTCGSFLFWQGNDDAFIGLSLGAITGPTGVIVEKHIFVGSKGDYYALADGLPQEEGAQ